ncbi:interleukin-10-like protein [Seal parapoxvirus]|uniref:Viral interleukin-10 homolog n=1 Tax=Seal parapoxvirus TaxID=187984 RepID=A0A1Z3GCP3_9POXV|nr:interleukin-10-like protein [Seal parapoxvirus]ASC55524.1 interleukin-10-like protein [Seal parapoxvirus]
MAYGKKIVAASLLVIPAYVVFTNATANNRAQKCFCFDGSNAGNSEETNTAAFQKKCDSEIPESLPYMLRDLRNSSVQTRRYFQEKDEENSPLLTQKLLEDFKGYLGCQALSEMIQFYLEEVMPQAEDSNPSAKDSVTSLGEKLKTLRLRLRRCHRFLPCENKSKAVENLKSKFGDLGNQGVHKAMSEFDIFINYIETYMTTKMK